MDRRWFLRAAMAATLWACTPVRDRTSSTAGGTTEPVDERSTPSRGPTGRTSRSPTSEPSAGGDPTDAPARSGPSPTPLAIPLLCREAWGARAAGDGLRPHTITRMTVHHAAVPLVDNTQAPAHLREYQRFHQDDHGWPDIAYHVAVDRRGHVYELRNPAYAGDTATSYDPAGHFLVLCDGNFDRHDPTEAQLEGLARILAWGATTFDCDPSTIAGHKAFAPTTSCPGAALQAALDEGTVHRRVRALLQAGGVDLVTRCGSAGREAVTAIERGRA